MAAVKQMRRGEVGVGDADARGRSPGKPVSMLKPEAAIKMLPMLGR